MLCFFKWLLLIINGVTCSLSYNFLALKLAFFKLLKLKISKSSPSGYVKGSELHK